MDCDGNNVFWLLLLDPTSIAMFSNLRSPRKGLHDAWSPRVRLRRAGRAMRGKLKPPRIRINADRSIEQGWAGLLYDRLRDRRLLQGACAALGGQRERERESSATSTRPTACTRSHSAPPPMPTAYAPLQRAKEISTSISLSLVHMGACLLAAPKGSCQAIQRCAYSRVLLDPAADSVASTQKK